MGKDRKNYVDISRLEDHDYVKRAYWEIYPNEAFQEKIKIKDYHNFFQKITQEIVSLHLNPNGDTDFTHMATCKVFLMDWGLNKFKTMKEKFEFADNWIVLNFIGDYSLEMHDITKHLFYDLIKDYGLRGTNIQKYKLVQMSKDINKKILEYFNKFKKEKFIQEINNKLGRELL